MCSDFFLTTTLSFLRPMEPMETWLNSAKRVGPSFGSSGIGILRYLKIDRWVGGFVQGSPEDPRNASQVQRGPRVGYTMDSMSNVSGADGCESLTRTVLRDLPSDVKDNEDGDTGRDNHNNPRQPG
jgi:hypothetical protein